MGEDRDRIVACFVTRRGRLPARYVHTSTLWLGTEIVETHGIELLAKYSTYARKAKKKL